MGMGKRTGEHVANKTSYNHEIICEIRSYYTYGRYKISFFNLSIYTYTHIHIHIHIQWFTLLFWLNVAISNMLMRVNFVSRYISVFQL
jgi:hypothetical protein